MPGPLKRPIPFRRKGRKLPGQTSDDDLGLDLRIRTIERPAGWIIDREFIQVGHIGRGDYVEIDHEGLSLFGGGDLHVDMQTDGDLFIGRDTTLPSKTNFSIFANSQTYNSESMGAGDMLLGDNSSGKKNMLWDDSDGAIKIRSGTTVLIELDASPPIVYVGDVSIQNLMLSAASGFRLREGTTVHAQLSGSLLRIGQATEENILLSTAGGLKIRDGSTVYAELSSSELQIGLQATENIRITNSVLQFRDGSTVYAQLSAAEWQIGRSGTEHIEITATALNFKDGSLIHLSLSSGVVNVGRTAQDHVRVSDSGVQVKDGSIVRGEWQTDGDMFLGTDVSLPHKTYFSIFANDQTYNSESVGGGDMLIGDNSASKANLYWDKSEGQLKFRGGQTTELYLDTDGSLVAGDGDVELDSGGVTLNPGTEGTKKIKVIDGGTRIAEFYGVTDPGVSSQLTLVGRGRGGSGPATPEGLVEIIAITHDGTAHGGAASVSLTLDTVNDICNVVAGIFRAKGAVFNELGQDVDFRIESDTFSNIFVVDASANSIGIGTTGPNSEAIMDFRNATKPIVLPLLTTVQRNAVTPAVGMLLYNFNTNNLEYYNGSAWRSLDNSAV